MTDHPGGPTDTPLDCRLCGACCAYSRDWPQLIGDRDGIGIPAEFLDGRGMRCVGDRCSALEGTIGQAVRCVVYPHRPLVCEEFPAGSDGCHMARAAVLKRL